LKSSVIPTENKKFLILIKNFLLKWRDPIGLSPFLQHIANPIGSFPLPYKILYGGPRLYVGAILHPDFFGLRSACPTNVVWAGMTHFFCLSPFPFYLFNNTPTDTATFKDSAWLLAAWGMDIFLSNNLITPSEMP